MIAGSSKMSFEGPAGLMEENGDGIETLDT